MGNENEISIVSSVSDAINSTNGIITAIYKAHMHKYEVADDYLKKQIVEHGFVDEKDLEIAAKLYAIPEMRKKYKNIARTLAKADQLCSKRIFASGEQASDIDDDWLELFLDKASLISDDKLQDIFAYILSQECCKTGSIRKVMIERLALLDQRSALVFKILCQLTYCVKVSDGREYNIPLYLRDTTLLKMVKNRTVSFSETQAIDYQSFIACKGLSPSFRLRDFEAELEILQDIGLVNLSDETDECELYSSVPTVYTFYIGNQDLGKLSLYDKKQKIFYACTGNVTYTKMGLDLYNALNSAFAPYSCLTGILEAYIQLQNEL